MANSQEIGFHDSTLTGVQRCEDGTISLLLEDIRVNGRVSDASVCLKGVRQIFRDGLLAQELVMECRDGEVLELEIRADSLRLLVEWNDFEKHRQQTTSYHILCENVRIEAVKREA